MGVIYRVAVINRHGQLIYQHSCEKNLQHTEIEKTFSYPLDLQLMRADKGDHVLVAFGERDGIVINQAIVAINNEPVRGSLTASGQPILQFLEKPENYPLSIRFGKPPLTINENLSIYSALYTLHALSSVLSPEKSSSGFDQIECESFKVNIFQTVSGVKFIVLSDLKTQNIDMFLKKLYELYADALKNPFYRNDTMPIKNSNFDNGLQFAIEQFEKTGSVS